MIQGQADGAETDHLFIFIEDGKAHSKIVIAEPGV
jgi:hypothetical protein